MRGINAIFTVAVLITSILAEDPWTPSPLCPFPSEEQTRYPYEGDCSKYWECFEGARYPMTCPSGLEFNAAESRCDDPSVANCDPDATIIYPTFPHSTQSTQSTLSTLDPGPIPECPFPSDVITYFPVVNNCSQYWECYEGNRYLMNCPSNLFWNINTNTCDYLDNVDCDRGNRTTTTSATPTTPLPTTTPPPTTTPLPTTAKPTTTDGPTKWTPDPLCPYPSDKLTFFPHPTNCSQYYECFEGEKFLMDCPNGLFWNDVVDNCDYAENVDCNRTSTTSAIPTTPNTTTPSTGSTANPICNGLPNGTLLPDPKDCSQFYECDNGIPKHDRCPGNLLWNQESHTCDYPERVNCTVIFRF